MLLVGLTGGIASGKTLVCKILEELGARTIDADTIARELVAPGKEGWDKIVEDFGRDFLLPDETLDRRKLADTIFADQEKRARLEAALHPLIDDEIAIRIELYAREEPHGIMVVDAALLIEVGKHEDFDKLIVVYADKNTQIDRLMARDNLSRENAYRRVHSQIPLASKLDYADYVIDNSGSLENTREEIVKVFHHLLEAAR